MEKLILDNVRYTRNQAAGQNGLITLWSGYLGINQGYYRFNSSAGAASLLSLNGRAKITNSNLAVDNSVYAFVSDSVNLDVSNTTIASNAASDRTYKPVLFYSTYEGGGSRCTREGITLCQTTDEPWRTWPNGIETCDTYLRSCVGENSENHNLRFRNNTFTGHWSKLLSAYLPYGETAPDWFTSTFLMSFSADSNGNTSQGTVGQCAIDGAAEFQGNMQVNGMNCLPRYEPTTESATTVAPMTRPGYRPYSIYQATIKDGGADSGSIAVTAGIIIPILAVFLAVSHIDD